MIGALGPDGALACLAIVVLAGVAAALGGALRVPWDGIVPFLAIAALLVATTAAVDLALVVRRRCTWPQLAARQLRALRAWTPFAVVYLAYRALRGALPALVARGHEDALRAADRALLGSSPAWSLAPLHARWLTELCAYAYATMFLLPLAVLLVLYARGRDHELRRVALALQVAFYLGFAVFLVVPARSPDVVYPFPPLVGYGFYEASTRGWRSLQAVTYDAFPSMHTAISTIALVAAIRLRRALSPRHPAVPVVALAPVVVLLQFSTLYLRQHYFVDLVAGWAVAAVAIAVASGVVRGVARTAPGSHGLRVAPTLQRLR